MSNNRSSLLEHILFPPVWYSREKLCQRLAGKTVLITGASFGIGECLARELAGTGAHLFLVARTEEKLIEVKHEVEARGGSAAIFPADLRDEDRMNAVLQALHHLPGGVDVVVNNAGKSIRRSIHDSLDRFHDFTRTMALNYLAPVQLLLSLIPTLERNQGQVINISAVNVLLAPAPYWAAYQASKTAFDQWFRCVAPELNARGVATSSIYLPLVRTRMIEPTEAYRSALAMKPEHVARIICKRIINRRRRYKPWWLCFAEWASLLLRGPWEALSPRFVQRKPETNSTD
jgi:short-subunit dehydrogenase